MSYHRPKSAFCLGALLALASCASTSKSPAWAPPENEVNLLHFAGDSLSGPLSVADGLAMDAEAALPVHVEISFLDSFPAHDLAAVSSEASLHSAESSDPIRVVPSRSALARVGIGSEAREWRSALSTRAQSLAEFETVLPSGVTLAVEFRSALDACAVEVSRDRNALPPAMVGFDQNAAVANREVSLLPHALASETLPLVVLAPDSTGGAIMWWFEASEALDPETQLARFTACVQQVNSISKNILEGIAPLESRDLEIRRLAGAVSALDVVKFHRPALVFLASQAGAPTAHDVAWLADDEFLGACVQRVLSTLAELESEVGREQTAWRLERACYRELAARFAADTLPPELVSILLRHAGELGHYPGLLNDVLIDSTNQGELSASLTRENKLFLEDRNPAARVRAFDWLEAREAAPAGYDPLAPRDERRAALAEVAQ